MTHVIKDINGNTLWVSAYIYKLFFLKTNVYDVIIFNRNKASPIEDSGYVAVTIWFHQVDSELSHVYAL